MRKHLILMTVAATLLTSCGGSKTTTAEAEKFDYTVEQFADLQILRYKVPGFEELTLKQKELIYYLTEAALEGRDILFDQNGKYNLRIRRMLEAVYTNYQGDKTTPDFKNMEVYLKRVWFSNGIHHHYGTEKFVPNFSQEFLKQAVLGLDAKLLPLEKGQTADQLCAELFPVIFDPAVMPKRVNQADGEDLVLTSACNYYDGVTQKEAERFYSDMKDPKDETPVSYGLNSRLVKENGKLTEKVWKVGGLYTQAIEKIVYWLKKAEGVAENEAQKAVITKLIQFYETGNLKDFDEYAILWVKDLDSRIDFVNGFTESYGDPLGMKASWESLVNFKDLESTHRTEIISSNAQWFEDHSPVDKSFKKEKVKGVSAKVITAAILAGDLYPATAIGINLPNANWIRAHHGSKSVTIGNITDAYNKAAHGNGFNEEFVYSDAEIQLIDAYSDLTDELHTDLHECLGHGSGKLLPGVDPDALKAYGSTIEEKQKEPFLKLVQTSSSHEPFEVPFHRLDDKILNSFAYADSCVGDFVKQYQETPLWKNTLFVLVPDHQGAYPYPIENPLDGQTIPLILIGGAIKQPLVVDTYASQIDIAATLLAQLGLPHDEFTFSKNIMNPASPHFAYFTRPNYFGMITADNQLVYNLDANTVQLDEGTAKGANLEKGKAFLQKLYDDLAKR